MKIILLNAPPNTGKDTIADYVVEKYGFTKEQFKNPLFTIAATLLGMTLEDFLLKYQDRQWKESVHPLLGISVRQLLIKTSEEWTKPLLGNRAFGVLAAERMQHNTNYIFSDSGFIEELDPIVEKFGAENILVVRIMREGCSYNGDSRSYLKYEHLFSMGVETPLFINNGTKEDMFNYFDELLGKVNE